MAIASGADAGRVLPRQDHQLEISSSVGGGYDVHARMLARHMGKYIPATRRSCRRTSKARAACGWRTSLYNTAPRDGTAFGHLSLRSVPFEPLFGNKAAQFDATRFTWIGSASNEVSICVAWHTSGVTTIDDLLTTELVVGSIPAPSADATMFSKDHQRRARHPDARSSAAIRGGNEMLLAMERGELGGRCAWSWSAAKATRRDWIEQKQVQSLCSSG